MDSPKYKIYQKKKKKKIYLKTYRKKKIKNLLKNWKKKKN